MAILESRTQTGVSWVKESVALFKTAPRKWLMLALVYVGVFMMLPSVKGLEFFALFSIIIWPVFLAFALSLYRNADYKKQQNFGEMVIQLQTKIPMLVGLGGACLLYALLISLVLNSDIQNLQVLAGGKDKMTESQMAALLQNIWPLLLKLTFLLVPLMMATWFSPMLIAFNNYSLVKAITASIAGSIQYMVALGAAWAVLTAGLIALMITVGMLAVILGALLPFLGEMLVPFVVFGGLLVATAVMLAFQYVSYRDVFRAA